MSLKKRLAAFVRRFWHDLPLAWKIGIFDFAIVILIVVMVTGPIIQREKASFIKDSETQAHLLLDVISERLRDPLSIERIDEIKEIASTVIAYQEITRFKVYSAGGWLKVDASRPNVDIFNQQDDPDPLHPTTLASPPDHPALFSTPDELIAEIAVNSGEELAGFVQMGFSTAPLVEKTTSLSLWISIIAIIAAIVGTLLSSLISRQLTNPISELTRTANKMAAGDLATHFKPQGHDEISQLGRAFNDMAQAIEKRETDLRELAHSLEQTVKDRTRELQQQNQYLAALHDVTLGLIENLNIEQLLEAIMTRAASLANAENAFVNIVDPERGEMQRRVAQGRYRLQLGMWTKLNYGLSGRVVETGQMMIEEDYQRFKGKDPEYDWLRTAIYVPLRSESNILGVIGLGYEQVVPINPHHVEILNQFAQLASLTLKNAQLYTATQQELSETEQALLVEEERRKAYMASPQGKAEAMVEEILKVPETAFIELHEFVQKADQNGNALILPELSGAMDTAGQFQLSRLAEGYHFIYKSLSEPELLTVGLRQLMTGLTQAGARTLHQADEAARIYALCQQAVEAGSIHSITGMMPSLRELQEASGSPSVLAGLKGVLSALLPVAEALHDYERVDTSEDRRYYLARALEGLSSVDRLAYALQMADHPIAQGIIENWRSLTNLSMSDLQTRAQISCRLLSRHSWKAGVVAVALQLRNEGHGTAQNLRVSLAQSQDYMLIDEIIYLDRLSPGEETQLEFHVQPQLPLRGDQFRAWFVILYDDPRGPNHSENFADIVYLLTQDTAFQFIPNPYVAGTPLEAGSPLFFGRLDLFSFIGENLSAAHHNNLVLIGQRRTGKSSFLKQLTLRLGDRYLPVYLDGQSIALDPGLPAFFSNLAMEISYAAEERGISIHVPSLQEFTQRPAHTFEQLFLRRALSALGDRHLVLLLDEFEELETATKRGSLDVSVFGFLRHLIQHESRLSVIFCGTHRLEELATDYWSVLFNISLYKHVGFLEYDEAVRLIQEPVESYGMCYDDLARDKIWRITAGHPYFLQLLCHSLVNNHNRAKRNYVTVSDVNSALSEILSSGEAHFIYLWNESNLAERQVLTVLSRIMTLTGHVVPAQVEDYLSSRGISLGRHAITETLQHLTLRDILTMRVDSQMNGMGGSYSWRLGLLGLWIEKYKSLSLLQEEALV